VTEVPEVRGQRPGDLADGVQRGAGVVQADGGGDRDHHRDHDELGEHSAGRGVPACLPDGRHGQFLVDHGALLVEDHPWHDHGTDVGRDQQQVGAVPQGH